MKQEKLEQKVIELFERQDFEVTKREDKLEAINDDQELTLKVFSSEKYSVQEVKQSVIEGDKVFVDQDLETVEEVLENVSVIRKDEEGKDYDLPSYELIGEIAVINELTVEESEAVEGILEHHPSVKTILLKEEPLQGEFRLGEYNKLHGEETETVHKEFGCKFKVDPTKVYYSERFSTERKRVVDQIDDGEKVLVMFAGVGPFAIMAAKLANPKKVVAIEKNPVAADYLKDNIELNEVGEIVEGYEGDVRQIVPELKEKFDRVIMPLPEKANQFIYLANKVVSEKSHVHLYIFGTKSDVVDYKGFELVNKEECGDKNPQLRRFCLELESKH